MQYSMYNCTYSLVILLHPPTPTYTYLHLPTPTYTYLHPPTPTYTDLRLPTPTYAYLHLLMNASNCISIVLLVWTALPHMNSLREFEITLYRY